MNKDTVTASILGFGLGLVAAIGIWIVPKFLPKNTTASPMPATQIQLNAEASPESNALQISTPANGEISAKDSISLTGKAAGAENILITTPKDSQIVKPGDDGKFLADVRLEEGVNRIAVTAYKGSTALNEILNVYYYPESL